MLNWDESNNDSNINGVIAANNYDESAGATGLEELEMVQRAFKSMINESSIAAPI